MVMTNVLYKDRMSLSCHLANFSNLHREASEMSL